MVIWLYINHILNNFVVINFVLLIFFTYTFMICILINFVVSMVENVLLEAPTPEEEYRESIPTVSTSAPGK
jgi:hypothetical protein